MISDFIKPENIIFELESTSKDELFGEIVECAVRAVPGLDRWKTVEALNEREEKMNTNIAPGIAVPHANLDFVKSPVIIIGKSKAGIDYESEDSEPVHLVFMILFEQGNAGSHLKLLAQCAQLMQRSGFYSSIMEAGSASEILSIIKKLEEEA